MPELQRPDGARIAWREYGAGPTVVLALQFFGMDSVFESLIGELTPDHRVVTYDLRGVGGSSLEGPYDMDTDAGDLVALIDALDVPVVIVPFGEGTNRAVRAGLMRPDAVVAVVSPAGNPVGREAAAGTDALAASDSVVEAITSMAINDYRGALRAMLSSGNPNLSEDDVRERVQKVVEHCQHEVALERFPYWIEDDATEISNSLGDRLWLLEHGTNPWFPMSVVKRTRELLPNAHIEIIEDGAISRPDITAGYVREVFARASVSQRPA